LKTEITSASSSTSRIFFRLLVLFAAAVFEAEDNDLSLIISFLQGVVLFSFAFPLAPLETHSLSRFC
jgi:hypothetical protein